MSRQVLVVFLIGLASTWRSAPGAQDAADANLIWEQMLGAKGGRERLEQIKTIEEIRAQHLYAVKPGLHDTDTLQVVLMALPDRFWQWFDGGALDFGTSVIMYNTALGLDYVHWGGEPQARKDTQPQLGLQRDWDQEIILLNHTSWVRPEPVRIIRDSRAPRDVDVLETHVDGPDASRVDFFIDRKTHLPRGLIIYEKVFFTWNPHAVLKVHYLLRKYKMIDGVMIPGYVGHLLEGVEREPMDFSCEVHLNVPYRPETFTEPPSVAAGPYAWKSRPVPRIPEPPQ